MGSVPEALNIEAIEQEAKRNAIAKIKELFQRPDQLEKVQQYRDMVMQKQSSVEAMLKSAVQSNLDGVKTGLIQLSKAQSEISALKANMHSIREIYRDVRDASSKLEKVKEENAKHSQLAIAVENVKYIFNVPECIKSCQMALEESKLLQAHKMLCDLETSQNDLLLELHNHGKSSSFEQIKVTTYFENVGKLRETLGKQLWLTLKRSLDTVRKEPKMIVNAVRIIEREEMADQMFLTRNDECGFLPPNRPLKWRNKCFETFQDYVTTRIVANEITDRSLDKRWITLNLEQKRQTIFTDLEIIKTHFSHCFPPEYKIVTRFLEMYHGAIAKHLTDLIDTGLNTREEIFEILAWQREYYSEGLMKHPKLSFDLTNFTALISKSTTARLHTTYLSLTKEELTSYLENALRSEKQLWTDNNYTPNRNGEGHLKTELPYLISSYCERTLNESKNLSNDLAKGVLNIWSDELEHFYKSYHLALQNYRDGQRKNRAVQNTYVDQIIANANSCQSLIDSMKSLCSKYTPEISYSTNENSKFSKVLEMYNSLTLKLCDYLIEELLIDTKAHAVVLFTPNWLGCRDYMNTINATIEDYNNDFQSLLSELHVKLMTEVKYMIQTAYYQALFSTKIKFKSNEQRKSACDQMRLEMISTFYVFQKLCPTTVSLSGNDPFSEDLIKILLSPLESGDTEMLTFELEAMKAAFPGLAKEKIINYISMREDLNKSEAESKVKETFADEPITTNTIDTFYSKLSAEKSRFLATV